MRWDTAAEEAAIRLQRLTEPDSILLDHEAADLRVVLHGLRCYRFERDSAQASVERILRFRQESEANHKAVMRRIWRLVDRKRKTLSMADLCAALEGRHETTTTDQADTTEGARRA